MVYFHDFTTPVISMRVGSRTNAFAFMSTGPQSSYIDLDVKQRRLEDIFVAAFPEHAPYRNAMWYSS
ncbi:hypothetical protein BSZ36_09635 [Rubricoccus marinus]|uniref:Uncharacterized protein n=1 Tax=Rubricoccus marinus TaxID=716817 RepID=A0A259TZN3_9BACT|nr:hypothetical protein BSZ36_09635 [Rubricoccus marinus]